MTALTSLQDFELVINHTVFCKVRETRRRREVVQAATT